MTELRDQIRRARMAYRSAHYPADLACQLLSQSTHRRRLRLWFLRITVGGALAAATALLIVHRGAPPVESPAFPVPEQLASSVRPVAPPAYQFPDRVPLTLPGPPLMPATPTVSISLTALNDLGYLQYQQLGPMLRQRFSWPNLVPPAAKPVDDVSNAATQQAV